jgi:ADP-heptose:LPS heptosyltransferase
MNVNTMRKIDHYVGVPLCFVATGIVKVCSLFSKRRPVDVKKILFVELSEMGSTILADPAMRKAKQHFDAALYFVIFKKNKVSLDLLKTVPNENIFTLREDNLFLFVWDVLRFFAWCRAQKFSAVIDLELFSRATALLTGFSGAPYRVGYYRFYNEGLYRGEMLTHRVHYNPHIHIAKNFIALVNSLISNNNEVPYSKTEILDSELVLPKVQSSSAEKELIYTKIKHLVSEFDPNNNAIILVNPNASDLLPQRRWMPENFIALMQKILADYPTHYILITGAPNEREQAEGLKQKINNSRCVNFAGQNKFAELPSLYNVSKLMVTNDSGPGHFSAVTNLQTFVLFGPETPALYGSLGNSIPIYAGLACSPCVSAANHRKTACQNNVCLQVLTVDRVYNTIKSYL